ncbi:MAG: prepilin-type N-terminal cleavage/methylation domain-containing protein [Planctomycetales bacterium]|nr:prepilin-type N-terminal cleavage/methylation domain-containing protein [Planctomycetales bacterium]
MRPDRRGRRRGFSLIELIAALALVGVVAIAGSKQFRLAALGVARGGTVAHRLAIDLQRARRMAINSGVVHRLVFRRQAGRVAEYRVMRGSVTLERTELPLHVQVSASGTPRFRPTGAAGRGLQIVIGGAVAADAATRWQIEVAGATGCVRVTRLN